MFSKLCHFALFLMIFIVNSYGSVTEKLNLCKKGDMKKCYEVGNDYFYARGVIKNYKKAIEFYNKSCKGNYIKGCLDTASMYSEGMGTKQNYKIARDIYKRTCDKNSSLGCSCIAYFYLQGKGVPKNTTLAIKYYQKSCKLGSSRACDRLKELTKNNKKNTSKANKRIQEKEKNSKDGNTISEIKPKELPSKKLKEENKKQKVKILNLEKKISQSKKEKKHSKRFVRDNQRGVVIDNKTNLIWQDDYRDNGGKIKKANWNNADKYCQNLSLGGYSDWRLPNVDELSTIIDNEKIYKVIFTQIKLEPYWSSTTFDYQHDFAWTIHFGVLDGYENGKNGSTFIRCVRTKQSNIHEEKKQQTVEKYQDAIEQKINKAREKARTLIDKGLVTITGNTMWEGGKNYKAKRMEWSDATKYCQNLRLGGFDDWRIPLMDELNDALIKCGARIDKSNSFVHIPKNIANYRECYKSKGFQKADPNADSEDGYITYGGSGIYSWLIDVDKGEGWSDNAGSSGLTYKHYIRCVRKDYKLEKGEPTTTFKKKMLQGGKYFRPKKMNRKEAIKYCQQLNWGGYNDWYLPSKKDIKDIMLSCGAIFKSIRGSNVNSLEKNRGNISYQKCYKEYGFLPVDEYWTSALKKLYHGTSPESINFYFGEVKLPNENNLNYVRCIRDNINNIDEKPVTIIGSLMWQGGKSFKPKTKNFDEAINYCKNLKWGKYSDWRLPHISELKSVVKGCGGILAKSNKDNESYQECYKEKGFLPDGYMSSITDEGNPWNIDFEYGNEYFANGMKGTAYVRCIRDINKIYLKNNNKSSSIKRRKKLLEKVQNRNIIYKKRNTSFDYDFKIDNLKNYSLHIDDIENLYPRKIIKDIGFFRFINTTSYNTTDVGPYRELYLVFHSIFEMPHRKAVFKIGNFFKINSIEYISNGIFKIKGIGYMKNNDFNEYIKNKGSISILIDVSEIIESEIKYQKNDSDFEGYIPSSIKIKTINSKKNSQKIIKDKNKHFTVDDIKQFVRYYYKISMENFLYKQLELYNFPIEQFYDKYLLSRDELRDMKEKYILKWKRRFYFVENIDIISIYFDEVTLKVTYNWAISSINKDRLTGISKVFMKLKYMNNKFYVKLIKFI